MEIEKAAPDLARRIADAGGRTVAVADMTDLQGRVTELGRFLAEELSVALVNAPARLQVIDRGHIRALLAEHKLAEDGLIDPETAAELGRIAGVDVLVTGTVTETSQGLRITVKALDTRSAAIVAATALTAPQSQAAASLLRRDVILQQGAATGGPARPPVGGAPNVRSFQSDFLIVTVESASVSPDGRRTTVVLTFENKGTQEEFVATGNRQIVLTDNRATPWLFRDNESSGLIMAACTGTCHAYVSEFTRIAAGSSATVVLGFRNNGRDTGSLPTTLSLSMNCWRRRGESQESVQTFAVGISRIPVG
jgi:TolB-like protein